MSRMEHRFGRDWPEVYQVVNGCMWIYEPEYYRLQRKEHYEERQNSLKWCLEHWEHEGYGYFTYRRERENDWLLSRIDLDQYQGISYVFHTREQMEERIKREGWRPFEQLTLDI